MNRFLITYFILVLSILPQLFAQNDYSVMISNCNAIDGQTYEFDLYIHSNEQNFELTSYQGVLTFNYLELTEDDNSLTFFYIDGSSGLSNYPSSGISINSTNAPYYYLTFASSAGSDLIDTKGKRIGKFQIKGSKNFSNALKLNWNFQGNIGTIFTGKKFENITETPAYYIEEENKIKINIVNAEVSSTTDLNTSPEKTFDGLGFEEGDLNSRWAAQPLPQWIIYDLGVERPINTSKISFYKFELERIYTYSISVSNDKQEWDYIITEATSLPERWTQNSFDKVNARYIRIEILSATNNPDNWAGIWEAEFYSTGIPTDSGTLPELPVSFHLEQNYPNPFNPSTTINFSLHEKGFTKLVIYNAIGELVTELVNGELDAGNYSINYNAENLPSGIYIYSLNSNNFNQVKKMVLLK